MIEVDGVTYYLDEPTVGEYRRILEFKYSTSKRQNIKERYKKLTYLVPAIYGYRFSRQQLVKDVKTDEDEGQLYLKAKNIVDNRLEEVMDLMSMYTRYRDQQHQDGESAKQHDEETQLFTAREHLRQMTHNIVVEGEKVGFTEMSNLKITDYMELLDATQQKENRKIIDSKADDEDAIERYEGMVIKL